MSGTELRWLVFEYDWHSGIFDTPHAYWASYPVGFCAIRYSAELESWG